MSTWKGIDKPAGCSFYAGTGGSKHLTDCPTCKYGSILPSKPDKIADKMKCIDCGAEFYVSDLVKRGILRAKPFHRAR